MNLSTTVPAWRDRGRRIWIVIIVAFALFWLGLHVVQKDLSAPVTVLLAGQLHLRPDRVRIGRAHLHLLGEMDLWDVAVDLGGKEFRAEKLAVFFDPFGAARGQLLVRWLLADGITADSLAGSPIRAARAHYFPQQEGQARLQIHGLQITLLAALPLYIDHASLDLQHGAPQRLGASGVRLGTSAASEVLAWKAGAGVGFRWALPEAQAVGTLHRTSAAADFSMSRLLLPDLWNPVLDLAHTRMSGQLHLALDEMPGSPPAPPGLLSLLRPLLGTVGGAFLLGGRVQITDLSVNHPLLAAVPLPDLTLVLDGETTLIRRPAEGGAQEVLLSTPGLSLTLGEARVSLAGDLSVVHGQGERQAHYRADLEVVLDEIECARLLASLPPNLVPQLEGLGVSGQMGGVIRVALDSSALPELTFATDLSVGCEVASDPPLADARTLVSPHLSIERPGEDGRPHRLPLGALAPGADGVPGFQPLSGLAWPILRTFLVAEDNLFYQHHGFDVQMIGRALGTDLQEQRTSRGASTITQQLVKNLWLGQERALGRKMEEAVLAWRVEQVVPKERILEIYLNLVELGSGIYGIAMAAQHYFGLAPERLTLEQAAQLAALLPAPRRGMDAAWSRRYRDLIHRLPKAPVPR